MAPEVLKDAFDLHVHVEEIRGSRIGVHHC